MDGFLAAVGFGILGFLMLTGFALIIWASRSGDDGS